MTDTAALNDKLNTMRAELLARNERTHRHIHGRDERVSANFSDQSQEMENQELVLNLDAEGREELQLIEAALQWLADGSYGLCQECGKEVQEARLHALPHTPYCVACASDME